MQQWLFEDGVYDQIQQAGVYFEMCHIRPEIDAIKIGECLRGWVKMNFHRRPLTSIRRLVAFCPSAKRLLIESKLLRLFAQHRIDIDSGQYENALSVELFHSVPVLCWLTSHGFVGDNGDPAIIGETKLLDILQ